MTSVTFLLLVLAGVAAGLAGSIGGLASLFSYPALLAAGLTATGANVTNTVALAVSSLSSITSSRPELVGQRARIRTLGAVSLVGGAIGAALVLVTPNRVFAQLVPFLVGGASVALLVRAERPAPEGGEQHQPRNPALLLVGTLGVAVYGGYFGAAAGVLMVALLLSTLPETLVRVNALKNVLLGLANVVAAVGFALLGPISWSTALPLTLGLLGGNWVGPWVARRLPSRALRLGIAVAGIGLAVTLGWNTFAGQGG